VGEGVGCGVGEGDGDGLAVGDGEGDGDAVGDGDGLGVGDGEAVRTATVVPSAIATTRMRPPATRRAGRDRRRCMEGTCYRLASGPSSGRRGARC
jgi:hypothetical protein